MKKSQTPWKQIETKIGDKQALITIDSSFLSKAPILELPKLLWIGIYCQMPPQGGYWHPDETVELNKVEDDLLRTALILAHGWAVYTMRVATPGLREYYFYFSDNSNIIMLGNTLNRLHPTYKIEHETILDEKWEKFGEWMKMVKV
jgi:hypothetical protein